MKLSTRYLLAATAALISLAPVAPAQASDVIIDVTDLTPVGDLGTPGNPSFLLPAIPGVLVDLISWDLTITVNSPSWATDAQAAFGPSSDPAYITFTPLFEYGSDSGTFSVADSVSLADLGIAFNLDADGLLNVEFYDFIDDVPGVPDSIWISGSLTFHDIGLDEPLPEYPEPATWAMMIGGFALAGAAMRRRKASVSFA